MDSMDNFSERFEALERRTQMVEQRLRWWRGIACVVVMLSLLSLALPSGKAADAPEKGMAERMATVEKKLAAIDFDDAANEVVISGANLRIVDGLGNTRTTNGLGNLIVGYNELRQELFPACPGSPPDPFCTDRRTGSHNVVVGEGHNFSSFGGLVIGSASEISGMFASVSGGGIMSPAEISPQSAGEGGITSPAAQTPRSVVGSRTRPAVSSPRSVGEMGIRPAALSPRPVGGAGTWPAASRPRSAEDSVTRPVASSLR